MNNNTTEIPQFQNWDADKLREYILASALIFAVNDEGHLRFQHRQSRGILTFPGDRNSQPDLASFAYCLWASHYNYRQNKMKETA